MLEDPYTVDWQDYHLGNCKRCGRECLIHDLDKMCLVCQYETTFKEMCIVKDEIQYVKRDYDKLAKKYNKLVRMVGAEIKKIGED